MTEDEVLVSLVEPATEEDDAEEEEGAEEAELVALNP